MTKEELEKEAIKYINSKQKPLTKYDLIAFAEPREKQIAGLSKHILELQKDKGNLIDEVRELQQQIEKMKKYMDCDYCEYVNDKDECHQCNYLEKTRWTLKKEIKEND